MKRIKVNNRSDIITKFMVDKHFEDFNKSLVVLANPKTVLNAKYAKKEVKEKVIRTDQLIKYIKDMYDKSKEPADSEERMLARAQFYLDLHKENVKDYTEKYEQYKTLRNEDVNRTKPISEATAKIDTKFEEASVEETAIFKELKAYRWNRSRAENIKPYFIYNDNQLKDLIMKMPRSKKGLLEVAGFGEVKVDKYGDDILKIIEKYI